MDNHKLIEQMKIFQNYLLDFLDMDGASKENFDNIRKFYLSNLIDSKRKQLLLIPLYQGLNASQKQWGLVNKLAGNHANGSAIAGSPPGWGTCD